MNNVLLDLRGNTLRVLITDGENVSYAKGFSPFSLSDPDGADQVLSEITKHAGGRLDRVHCILPSEEVSASRYTIPVMSVSDAEKVIRRKLIKETGASSPIFHILPTRTTGEKQTYIVETVSQETIDRYVDFFRDRKTSVKTISTALQANLKAIGRAGVDFSQTLAILDIGDDILEMIVLSNDFTVSYGKASIPQLDVDRELRSGKTPERLHKMRVYRIVESVYNAYTNYKNDYPDLPLRKLWVCGTGAALEGVHEALAESMNVSAASLNTFKDALADGYQFTALHGLALGLLDGTAVNFTPRTSARQLQLSALGKNAIIAMVGVYGLVAVTTAAFLESRLSGAKDLLAESANAAQITGTETRPVGPYAKHGQYLKNLLAKEVTWYGILGYLADNTPDGVFIHGLSAIQQAGRPSLEIDFVTPYYSEIGTKKFLTNIVAMIDRFPVFQRSGEPGISITKREQSKLVHVKIRCEVLSVEKTN